MTLQYQIEEIEKIIKHRKGKDCKYEEDLVKAWKKVLKKQLQHSSATPQ